MSYNGIGLQTPRGSGTSGYVQKNVALRKSEGAREKQQREIAEEHRREVRAKMADARSRAGAAVRSHDEKRYIELKCMELRERLEDEDMDDSEIEIKVKRLREELAQKQSEYKKQDCKDEEGGSGEKSSESKETSEKIDRMEKIRRRENVRDRRSVSSVRNRSRSPGVHSVENNRVEKKGSENDSFAQGLAYGYVPRYNGR